MITATQLVEIMPLAVKRAALYIDPLNRGAQEFEINTPARRAAWIAQLAVESGELIYTSEIASGVAYNNRADLGNLDPQAARIAQAAGVPVGSYWKGHGLIQITGFYNHQRVAQHFNIPIDQVATWLQSPEGAARSAAWFWGWKGLNVLADQGDFLSITKRINGGTNGLPQRMKYWEAAKRVFAASEG